MGIAQLAEHRTVAPAVAGSIPVSHPKFFWRLAVGAIGTFFESRPLDNRGPVAQLDRASDFGSEGWGFDSLRGRHKSLCFQCRIKAFKSEATTEFAVVRYRT